MNLLFVTQSYDADSTILGVTADWVHALARRCSSVHVLAQRAGRRPPNAPANVTVHSLGKERGAARHRQLGRLLATLGHVLLNAPPAERATAIFVHMVPRYAALAAPLAKLCRVPLMLWYAQGGVSRDLHIAHRLVDRVVSASRRSYPLDADRLVVVGHGIDTDRYAPAQSRRRHDDGPLLLSVGRLSPAKDHETTIEALAVLHAHAGTAAPPILRICGAPLYPSDEAYAERLRRRVDELGLEQAVQFAGNVPYAAMPAEYRRTAVCLHTSRTGSLDKAALEPLACGVPVVTSNPAVQQELAAWGERLSFPAGDAARLAERVQGVLAWTEGERAAAAATMRQLVVQRHGLRQWADRVVALLGTLGG